MIRILAIISLLPMICASARAQQTRRSGTDPSMVPPTVLIDPGSSYADSRRVFQGVPTIERTWNGRLCAAWFARSKGKGLDCHVLLVFSDDGGRSWSKPKLVIDPPGSVCAFDPCLWLDPDGLFWLFWTQSNGVWDGRGGVWCITSETSQAYGPTWSAPRRLCDGVMLNKPTALGTGQALFPVSIWPKPAGASTPVRYRHDPGDKTGALVLLSRIFGGSFDLLARERVPLRDYDEHKFIEREDKSLWMLLRTRSGIAERESTDGGVTWIDPGRPLIPNINSRFSILRLRSHKLLLITHAPPDSKTRSHLIARISSDEGKTWQGGLMLDERIGVSYPDAIEDSKGVIRVIYDFERTQSKQILLAQFNERNVLRGKPSSTTRLRVLVNQATGTVTTKAKAEK